MSKMILIEEAKLSEVLEALEGNTTNPIIDPEQAAIEDKAITAIRKTLAEQPAIKQDLTTEQPAQQELVGKAYLCDRCSTPFDGDDECPKCGHGSATKKPVYTSPQPARQEPLTRDQVKAMMVENGYDNASPQERADFINGLRHGEVAHGITKGGAA